MTTYNGERYILKQLKSLLNQRRKADEVIIVDDGSTDRTVYLVESFIKKYNLANWYVLVNQENVGYKKNFYKSIERTTGDLIFLCDQDDEWEPEKLNRMEDLFDKHPEILSLNTAFSLIDRDSKNIEYHCRRGSYNNDLIRGKCQKGQIKLIPYDIIMKYNISPGCTMAFRKLVKDIYLDNSFCKLPHDWEINIIAASKNGLFFYNYPLIKYRIHDRNTLGMNTNDHISDFEFKGDIDFRKKALEDRKLFKVAMDEWNEKLNVNPKQREIYQYIVEYDALRRKCVFQREIKAWFKLIEWTFKFWDGKHIRFKTLFGDLYYIIK